MTGLRYGPHFNFLVSATGAVIGLPSGLPAGCTRPIFSLAQVRKPGAAVVVAVQALPELKLDVAKLWGTGAVAADVEYKCPQHAAFDEAVPPQPGGQVRCAERANGPSDIRIFPHQRHCFLPLRRQGPRGGTSCRLLKRSG
ncbi:hypothetical protein A8L50_22665 [Pantoea ananatis]|nr:hypothetical protein [Pantoea ananatis]NQE82122.1 hypothetical protein [Pantoea ananatis]